jgi:hypothetical protein
MVFKVLERSERSLEKRSAREGDYFGRELKQPDSGRLRQHNRELLTTASAELFASGPFSAVASASAPAKRKGSIASQIENARAPTKLGVFEIMEPSSTVD